MPRALDPDQENVLVARYLAGESTPKLAADYGIVPSTARSIIMRHGVQTRSGVGNPRSLDETREAELVARYYAGEGTPTLASAFGIATTTVTNILKRHGVSMRRCGYPQIPIWHEAFDELTPDAAYWIGFLFADGHVHQRKPEWAPEVIVALAARDRPHIAKLKSFLRSGHAISEGHTTPSADGKKRSTAFVRLAVTSHKLGGRLVALGRYEGCVDPGLAASRHFWRGLVDGDGSLGIYGEARSATFQLVGNRRYLTAFNAFLSKNGLACRSIGPTKSIFQVSASGASAEPIVDLLYRDAPTSLDRKAVIAQQIIGLTAELDRVRFERHEARVAEARRLIASGVSRVRTAELLGVGRATLRYWAVSPEVPERPDPRIAEAQRLHSIGFSKAEVMQTLGISEQTLRSLGIIFRTGQRRRSPEYDGRLF